MGFLLVVRRISVEYILDYSIISLSTRLHSLLHLNVFNFLLSLKHPLIVQLLLLFQISKVPL